VAEESEFLSLIKSATSASFNGQNKPGLNAKSRFAASCLCLGTSSNAVRIVEKVPPDIEAPPSFQAEVDRSIVVEGPPKDFNVLFATNARTSEGTESNPQQGTTIEPDLTAA
jgi:hypothetical protein